MIKRCCTYVSYTQQREITRLDAVKPTPHIRVEESMAYNAVLTPNNNLVAPRVGMITYIYTASTRGEELASRDRALREFHGVHSRGLIYKVAAGSRRFGTKSECANGALLLS